jgi:hypothetical protein
MVSSDDPNDVVMPPHNKAKQGRAVPIRQAPRVPKRIRRRSVGSAKRNRERKGTGFY